MTDRDMDAMVRRMHGSGFSRRRFLQGSALAGTSAFLAACGSSGATAAPSSAPSSAPSGAASAAPGGSGGPTYNTEGALYMYNWAEYIDLNNIDEYKKRYNITDWTYDVYDSNEVLLTKLQGGGTGIYDIGAPTVEFVKQMADEGYIVELPWDRIPNAKLINPTFQQFFDPNGPDAKYNNYHLPKDWGTTGIAIRKKFVTEEVKTWKDFFEIAPKYSGKIVLVNSAGDVLTAPLKALGYSLNSTDPAEIDKARELLMGLAPHVLTLDSNDYGDRLRTGEAVMGLVWTGGVVDLRDEPETADIEYIVPDDGTLYWMDTWVQFADAPHPEAGLAFLNFIHEPEIQAVETMTNRYATPNDAAMQFIDPAVLNDPTVFVPEEAFDRLEGAQNVSTDENRAKLWEDFSGSIGG